MITVFGSANIDLVAYAPEAPKPGETVRGRAFRAIPGGKGSNQAIAAARAGGPVTFIGAVGDDVFAPGLRAALRDAGVITDRLRVASGPSGIAHIVVDDSGANTIIVIAGANGSVTGLEPGDAEVVARSDALLLQLELPMGAVVAAATAGHAAGVPVMLTPAPAVPLPDALLAAVDIIVPNEHEAAAITGACGPQEAVDALLARVPEVCVTLGARGVLYGSRGGTRLRVPAPQVRAIDTTAAGDTFAGALAVARAEGRTPEEALRFATAAAALSVQREGASTSMPTRAEIEELRVNQ
jgi:ribokinase